MSGLVVRGRRRAKMGVVAMMQEDDVSYIGYVRCMTIVSLLDLPLACLVEVGEERRRLRREMGYGVVHSDIEISLIWVFGSEVLVQTLECSMWIKVGFALASP